NCSALLQFQGIAWLINQLTWSVGPGDRIGIIGANGSGKTTLLRLLTGVLPPQTGKVKHGQTLRLQVLSQLIEELPSDDTVLESVEKLKRETTLATGKEVSASTLLTDFGFTGDKLVTRIGELSGGERRRLQFLRLILSEPNVLVLDEPTNDLDIDTLNVIEDYLDGWPGTLIVVSHDRYFLERACDVIYGMLGDGTVRMLPRGVDEYLEQREAQRSASTSTERAPKAESTSVSAAARQAKKDLARIEQQLSKLDAKMSTIHQQMATAAADYDKLMDLQRKLDALQAEKDERELDWLSLAEAAE
ncbi:MAG: ATP-binding cassette domain-containing protein, partial [Propionibacteriaceae bacterium]